MNQAFDALKEIYFTLDLNFNRLFNATTTDEQRNALRLDYVAARNNFLIAQNKILHDDDAMVQQLVVQAQEAQMKVDDELVDLTDIVSALRIITIAVNIGSKLTSLAG